MASRCLAQDRRAPAAGCECARCARTRELHTAYVRERYRSDPDFAAGMRAHRRDWGERRQADPERREDNLARRREHYGQRSGFDHNRDMLRQRRWKALRRIATRNAERGESIGPL